VSSAILTPLSIPWCVDEACLVYWCYPWTSIGTWCPQNPFIYCPSLPFVCHVLVSIIWIRNFFSLKYQMGPQRTSPFLHLCLAKTQKNLTVSFLLLCRRKWKHSLMCMGRKALMYVGECTWKW
jgi:hypothetical protein